MSAFYNIQRLADSTDYAREVFKERVNSVASIRAEKVREEERKGGGETVHMYRMCVLYYSMCLRNGCT